MLSSLSFTAFHDGLACLRTNGADPQHTGSLVPIAVCCCIIPESAVLHHQKYSCDQGVSGIANYFPDFLESRIQEGTYLLTAALFGPGTLAPENFV
jgi:hypothetical protein